MPHVDFFIGGVKAPSATELTRLLPQEWLWSWFKNSVRKSGWRGWQRCNAQSKRGMRIGTEVHALIESFIKKTKCEPISGKYDSQAYADALFDKVNPLVTEWLHVEPHIMSERLRIHGTADAIALMCINDTNPENSIPVILDWKTSASKSDSHPIQLAIYALCWNEMNSVDQVHTGVIARVDKKSKRLTVHLDVYENLDQYYPVVEGLKKIWDYCNGR